MSVSEIDMVRIEIGDFEEPYSVPDRVVQIYLNVYSGKDQPLRIWCAAIDSIKYQLAKYAKDGARRRERRGSEEIEVYANELVQASEKALRSLIRNPPAGVNRSGIISFGGTSVEEVRRVSSDPDSVDFGPVFEDFEDTPGFSFRDQGSTYVTS